MINLITSKQFIRIFFNILIIGIYVFKDFGINIEEHWQRLSGFYWLNFVYEFLIFNFLRKY